MNVSVRTGISAVVLTLSLASVGAQGPGRGTTQSESAQIQQVRVALGHGQVADARRLAEMVGTAAGKDLASALVDLFEGKDDAARTKLEPLARVNAGGDAALELGLLEMRRGQRQGGFRRLDPLASVRKFGGPEDYYRLARAAEGIREYQLAADAYVETAAAPRADIQASRGDMFLMRHKPGDAVTDYKRALEIDPAWMPALIGMARALGDENPEAADTALAEATKRAPNHPDLLILMAERALAAEDVPAAVAALDKAAAARAAFLDEAALRAFSGVRAERHGRARCCHRSREEHRSDVRARLAASRRAGAAGLSICRSCSARATGHDRRRRRPVRVLRSRRVADADGRREGRPRGARTLVESRRELGDYEEPARRAGSHRCVRDRHVEAT